jgi:hypothetical protein
MRIKEETHSDSFFSRSIVCCNYKRSLLSNLDEKDVKIFVVGTMGTKYNIL